jgi:hypothetical protein
MGKAPEFLLCLIVRAIHGRGSVSDAAVGCTGKIFAYTDFGSIISSNHINVFL